MKILAKDNPLQQGLAVFKPKDKDYFIRQEAAIGGEVLGRAPKGRSREFFCLDEHTWIWYESWFDKKSRQSKHLFVRYEFSDMGVLKVVNDVACGYIDSSELKNLLGAMNRYDKLVRKKIYSKFTSS